MSVERPWFKFYPSDWRGDEKLILCSLATRGFWIDALGLMHTGVPYGYLTAADGTPLDAKQLSKVIGVRVAIVRQCIAELTKNGVCSVAENGAIYSRRMVNDRKKSRELSERGRKGGNPRLLELVKPQDKPQDIPAHARSRDQRPETRGTPPSSEDQKTPGRATARARLADETTSTTPKTGTDAQRFVKKYADLYREVRRQEYGHLEKREWKAVADLLKAYPDHARLWTMAESFIRTDATGYPYDGGRTITDLWVSRKRIEGQLIAGGVLPGVEAASDVA